MCFSSGFGHFVLEIRKNKCILISKITKNTNALAAPGAETVGTLGLQAGWKDLVCSRLGGMEKLGGSKLQSMPQLQVVKRGYRIKSTEMAPQLHA